MGDLPADSERWFHSVGVSELSAFVAARTWVARRQRGSIACGFHKKIIHFWDTPTLSVHQGATQASQVKRSGSVFAQLECQFMHCWPTAATGRVVQRG